MHEMPIDKLFGEVWWLLPVKRETFWAGVKKK